MLDLALIPAMGIEGAAIASSIAYIASLVATLYWYRKVSGGSIVDALVVRPADAEHYLEAWRSVTGRLGFRRG